MGFHPHLSCVFLSPLERRSVGKEVGKKQTKKRRQPFVTVQRSLSSFAALAACHLLQLSRLEPRQTLFPPPPFFFCSQIQAGVTVPVLHIAFSGTSLQAWALWELGLALCGPRSPFVVCVWVPSQSPEERPGVTCSLHLCWQ